MNYTEMLDEMNAEMKALRDTYKEKSQGLMKKVFAEFFEKNPEVHAVGWRQYTPYFNDGDPCVFRCNAAYAWATNTKDTGNVNYGEYEGDEENVWVSDADYGDFNEELIPDHVEKALDELRRFLGKVSDDVYLSMFEDHVKVTATRDGFDVEEYDHD